MNGVAPAMSVAIILLIAVGLGVAAMVDHISAFRRGQKSGDERTLARLRRLYVRNRAACEYELLTGKPLETVRPQLPRPRLEALSGITFPPASQASRRPIE